MKILVVVPLAFGGGAEQVAAILSREWSRTHTVKVLVYQHGAGLLDFGVPVESLGIPARLGVWRRAWVAWRRVIAVRRAAAEFRPDVVMAFMDEAGMICVLAGLVGGWLSRLVVSVHHNPQWLSATRRKMLALFYHFPARVVAVSQGVQSELERTLHIERIRLAHIPNPLVLAESNSPDSGKSALPEKFLLFVGRLDWSAKGLDVLLDAYAKLPDGRPKLLIVGDGPDRERVLAYIHQLGVDREVELVGWVGDPRPYYRRASVFVMSSRFEGWSNVLMEAMGEGCLVAGTDCPYGPSEIMGQELKSWLAPVGDARGLACLIEECLSLPEERRYRLSQALRERARTFSAGKVAQKWIELAQELAASGPVS